MALPTFLIIGAAKSGTTSLATNLTKHPDVFVVTQPKEPNYFAHNFKKGQAWYESLFEPAGAKSQRGESSPSYTFRLNAPVADRVAQVLPEARLIYIVRNPLERIRSHWMQDQHSGGRGRDPRPFEVAVREQPHLIESSRYMAQLDLFRRHVPDDRILLLFHDDLRQDASAVFRRCFAFLGVDPDVPIEDAQKKVHVKEDLRSTTPTLAAVRRLGRALLGENVTQRLPLSWKVKINKTLGRDIAPAQWTPATQEFVREKIGDDLAAYLEHAGKPRDFWRI